jgi:hypothetical protein
VPKRDSGNPAKRAAEARQRATDRSQHKHAEAFCLMRYRADNRHLEEVLWNSRDGATPFVITMRDGTPGTHVDWRGDTYAPDHQPAVGDRIFIDLTQERAGEIARKNAESIWERPRDTDISYSVRDHFESMEQLAAYLLDGLTAELDRSAPDLLEVTEQYARAHGWPVERGADRLKRVLDEA